MASPSTVVSLGYGSFGSINLLPTLGFGQGEAPEAGIPSVPAVGVTINRGPGRASVQRIGPVSATPSRPV